jgi:hypothetical protein
MSAPLPRPSASSGDGTSGRATARGKIALASQRKNECDKLLAVVAKSREPAIAKTRAHKHMAPATPSSVERANRLYQRAAFTFSLILDVHQHLLRCCRRCRPLKKATYLVYQTTVQVKYASSLSA